MPLGKLNKEQFFKAVKLIAIRQAGGALNDDNVGQPAALPGFQGIDLSAAAAATSAVVAEPPLARHTGASSEEYGELDQVQLELGLSPPEMHFYQALWAQAETVDNVLPAQAGVQFFNNSGWVFFFLFPTLLACTRPCFVGECPPSGTSQ